MTVMNLAPWTFLIASHAIAASLALVIGAFQILRPKRGDPIHKLTGRIWVGLMLYVSIFSFAFGGYTDGIDIFLRCLALWTVFCTVLATWCARHGKIAVHRGFMVGTYLGLVGAFIAVVAIRTRRVPSWFAAHPLEMSLVALAIIAVSGMTIGGILQYHQAVVPARKK